MSAVERLQMRTYRSRTASPPTHIQPEAQPAVILAQDRLAHALPGPGQLINTRPARAQFGKVDMTGYSS